MKMRLEVVGDLIMTSAGPELLNHSVVMDSLIVLVLLQDRLSEWAD